MAQVKTKVKISGTAQAKASALQFLNNTVKDTEFLNQMGQLTADQIRNRVRASKVDPEYAQKELKEISIAIRKDLIKEGNSFDSKIVKADRSNLSMTGQLLDAITYRINQSLGEISIFLKTARKPLKFKNGRNIDGSKSNVEIKNELESKGRKFLFISERLKAQLESRITAELRRKLALYNKIRRKLSL